jgi:hypothetical protein
MAAVRRMALWWVGNDRGLLVIDRRVQEWADGATGGGTGIRADSSGAGQQSIRRSGTMTCHD